MKKKENKPYIQVNKRKYVTKDGIEKTYTVTLLRRNYTEKGKIKHKTIANLTHLPPCILRATELSLKEGKGISYKLNDLKFIKAKSFGDIAVPKSMLKDTGIERAIHTKDIEERAIIEAMIIARIMHPSSKLENTRWFKERSSVLNELFGYRVNFNDLRTDDLYRAMDYLITRKEHIEKVLFRIRKEVNDREMKSREDSKDYSSISKHYGSIPLLVWYYKRIRIEGKEMEDAAFGYNRDRKKGKKQIVIGLVTDNKGYPISVTLFKGNTADQSTIVNEVKEIKDKFNVKDAVIIGDRGMITHSKIEQITEEGFKYITGLTHRKIKKLIEQEDTPFQIGLFDKRGLAEIHYNGKRYILCKTEEGETKDRETLSRLMDKTKEKLNSIEQLVNKGRLKHWDKIALRAGRWLNRWKMGKFFNVEIKDGYSTIQLMKNC